MRNSIIATTTEAAAYADGSKTAFIELVKPQPQPSDVIMIGGTDTYAVFKKGDVFPYKGPFLLNHTIYVREAWLDGFEVEDAAFVYDLEGELIHNTWYKAMSPNLNWFDGDSDFPVDKTPWKSPCIMPKSVARTWLLLTGIERKRVQDLSDSDISKLGIQGNDKEERFTNYCNYIGNMINDNPYIFLYTCKKVDKP